MERLGFMRKLILLVTFLGLGTFAAPAFAAPVYPPGAPIVTVDNSSPAPGAKITLTAQGFCPGSIVNFSIGGISVGSATADASGKATLPTTAPGKAGTYVVIASSSAGGACTLSAQSSINVAASVPATGANSETPLKAGAIAVLSGGLLVAVASYRRRRPRTVAA